MKITFLTRERVIKGTAIANAAGYDFSFLAGSRLQDARIVSVKEADEMPVAVFEESDLVIIEGAGWFPVQSIKRPERTIIRTHAAPEFLYYEFAGPVTTTEYLMRARSAGVRLGFVSKTLADLYAAEWMPIRYKNTSKYDSMDLEPLPVGAPVHVGCFGAIRPLKNHMGELIAIAELARRFPDRDIYMHINTTRVEGCSTILPELRAASKVLGVHIAGHEWEPLEPRHYTIGLFGSYAESFCLTAADFVSAGVPSVLSCHVPWAFNGISTDTETMYRALRDGIADRAGLAQRNMKTLAAYSDRAAECWINLLDKVK